MVEDDSSELKVEVTTTTTAVVVASEVATGEDATATTAASASAAAAEPAAPVVIPETPLVQLDAIEVFVASESLITPEVMERDLAGGASTLVCVSHEKRGGRAIGIVDGVRQSETTNAREFRVKFIDTEDQWVELKNYGMELVLPAEPSRVAAVTSAIAGGAVAAALVVAEAAEPLEAEQCEGVVDAVDGDAARVSEAINAAGAVLIRSSAVLMSIKIEMDAVAAKVSALPASVTALFGTVAWIKMPSYPWWPSYIIDPNEMPQDALAIWNRCNETKEVVIMYLNDNRYGKAKIEACIRPWTEENLATLRLGRIEVKRKKKKGKKGKKKKPQPQQQASGGGAPPPPPSKPCSAKIKLQLDGAVEEALRECGSARMFSALRRQFLYTKLGALAPAFSEEHEAYAERKHELRLRVVKCAKMANRGRKLADKLLRRETREARALVRREMTTERRLIRQRNAEARLEAKSERQMAWDQRRAIWAERKAGKELSARARQRMRNLHSRPPKFRRLRMNKYPNASWRNRIAPSEAPVCDCKKDGGCTDDCINMCLFVECAVGCCPSVAAKLAEEKARRKAEKSLQHATAADEGSESTVSSSEGSERSVASASASTSASEPMSVEDMAAVARAAAPVRRRGGGRDRKAPTRFDVCAAAKQRQMSGTGRVKSGRKHSSGDGKVGGLMQFSGVGCPEIANGTAYTVAAPTDPRYCMNSILQRRAFPKSEPFTTDGKGWGLRSLEVLAPGTIVREYLGEVIDADECAARLKQKAINFAAWEKKKSAVEAHGEIKEVLPKKTKKKTSSNGDDDGSQSEGEEDEEEEVDPCTADCGGFDFYFASLEGDMLLDAEHCGDIARFANSSCWPNCTMQRWTVLGESRLALVTTRPIMAGEELTYNYHSHVKEVEDRNQQKCLCGNVNCCGAVGGNADTSELDACLKNLEFLIQTLNAPTATKTKADEAGHEAEADDASTDDSLEQRTTLNAIQAALAEAERLGLSSEVAKNAEEEMAEFQRWREARRLKREQQSRVKAAEAMSASSASSSSAAPEAGAGSSSSSSAAASEKDGAADVAAVAAEKAAKARREKAEAVHIPIRSYASECVFRLTRTIETAAAWQRRARDILQIKRKNGTTVALSDVEKMLTDVPTTIAIDETDELRVLVERTKRLGEELSTMGLVPTSPSPTTIVSDLDAGVSASASASAASSTAGGAESVVVEVLKPSIQLMCAMLQDVTNCWPLEIPGGVQVMTMATEANEWFEEVNSLWEAEDESSEEEESEEEEDEEEEKEEENGEEAKEKRGAEGGSMEVEELQAPRVVSTAKAKMLSRLLTRNAASLSKRLAGLQKGAIPRSRYNPRPVGKRSAARAQSKKRKVPTPSAAAASSAPAMMVPSTGGALACSSPAAKSSGALSDSAATSHSQLSPSPSRQSKRARRNSSKVEKELALSREVDAQKEKKVTAERKGLPQPCICGATLRGKPSAARVSCSGCNTMYHTKCCGLSPAEGRFVSDAFNAAAGKISGGGTALIATEVDVIDGAYSCPMCLTRAGLPSHLCRAFVSVPALKVKKAKKLSKKAAAAAAAMSAAMSAAEGAGASSVPSRFDAMALRDFGECGVNPRALNALYQRAGRLPVEVNAAQLGMRWLIDAAASWHERASNAVGALALAAGDGTLTSSAETDAVRSTLELLCEVRSLGVVGVSVAEGAAGGDTAPLQCQLQRGLWRVVTARTIGACTANASPRLVLMRELVALGKLLREDVGALSEATARVSASNAALSMDGAITGALWCVCVCVCVCV
tara:strand:+ start:158 stop:5497 length:5340 start_codon:yes stop_codon:yes gene_type:complete